MPRLCSWAEGMHGAPPWPGQGAGRWEVHAAPTSAQMLELGAMGSGVLDTPPLRPHITLDDLCGAVGSSRLPCQPLSVTGK